MTADLCLELLRRTQLHPTFLTRLAFFAVIESFEDIIERHVELSFFVPLGACQGQSSRRTITAPIRTTLQTY
jgi:hypothetical protein